MRKTKPSPAAHEAEAYVDLEAAAEALTLAEAEVGFPTTAWLTTAASEAFGPAGHIRDLTAAQVAAAPEGLLVAPTPEQLAQRL